MANKTGKGGFADHPENQNAGGRPQNSQSFTYWMRFFKDMTVAEFKNYEKTHPEDEMTVAESLAYARLAKSRGDLKEFKEVADRTEGMSVRRTEITGAGGDELKIALVEIVGATFDEDSNQIS